MCRSARAGGVVEACFVAAVPAAVVHEPAQVRSAKRRTLPDASSTRLRGVVLTSANSVELLVSAQTAEGAIPASTGHDIYRYGWLRDGSWCAYALDRAGQTGRAAAWHHWVARTLLAHEHRVNEALHAVRTGTVTGRVMMPARFTLDGREEAPGDSEEERPNFQTDCYSFWLWTPARRGRCSPRATGRAGR